MYLHGQALTFHNGLNSSTYKDTKWKDNTLICKNMRVTKIKHVNVYSVGNLYGKIF